MVIQADILPMLNHLAWVFPLPFYEGRRLERALFSFVWGGSTELVARAVMFKEVGKGGRGVPCAPVRVMCMHTSFQSWLAMGMCEHRASVFARFWLGSVLRSLKPLGNALPWSDDRPWNYVKVADFIRANKWCLVGGDVSVHKTLYAGCMERQRNWKEG